MLVKPSQLWSNIIKLGQTYVGNLMSLYKKKCLNLNGDEIKRFGAKRDPNEWVTCGMTHGMIRALCQVYAKRGSVDRDK